MEIITKELKISSRGHTDIIDITDDIQKELGNSGFSEGNVTVFAIGSTGAVSTIEYEPGLTRHDVYEMFEKFIPYDKNYEHNKTWGDDNGSSHLRSTLTGTSMAVPFNNGELILGTWQQIVFIDYDTRPRNRKIVLQFLGK